WSLARGSPSRRAAIDLESRAPCQAPPRRHPTRAILPVTGSLHRAALRSGFSLGVTRDKVNASRSFHDDWADEDGIVSLAFALGQFEAAVRALASDADRIRPRLARVFADHLAQIDPAKDIPAPLRGRVAGVRMALTHLGRTPAEPWAAAIGMDEAHA